MFFIHNEKFKYSKAYSGSDHIIFEENDVFIAKVPLSDAIHNSDDQSNKPDERIGEGLNEEINEGLNPNSEPKTPNQK
jgi:hypothetical protein